MYLSEIGVNLEYICCFQVSRKLCRKSFTGVGHQVEHPHSPQHHYTVHTGSRLLNFCFMRIRLETCYLDTCMSTFFFVGIRLKIVNFFCRDSPQNHHTNVTQMCIRAQPFSTYHGKICSDHVLFIPTWMPKRVQDLDLRNEADCELLSYGAYVYALGCCLMVNVQWVIPSRPATWRY